VTARPPSRYDESAQRSARRIGRLSSFERGHRFGVVVIDQMGVDRQRRRHLFIGVGVMI
jgi:hypothetical protein